MAPNVIATWTPNADAKEWVVAGAHLDSRSEDNQSETDRAPGADDNGRVFATQHPSQSLHNLLVLHCSFIVRSLFFHLFIYSCLNIFGLLILGTGSAAILEVARLINQTDVMHNRGLHLCLFTGEEQGLVGSRAIASKWAEEGENIYAMVNADMLG